MSIKLRQSTASQEIPLGCFVDSTDGNTEETALTINNTDIKLWKSGATTLANKNSGGATHISNGVYYCVLDATDTNTIGPLVIFVHVSGALAVRVECEVLDEAVFDVHFGTTAPSTLTAAQVNAEVLDVLNVDTFAEPTGAPAATTTLAGKIGRIYQALRNKVTVASGAKTFFDDAGASLWSKTLSDNGTTYTENEGS